jgi:beta-xylosidase
MTAWPNPLVQGFNPDPSVVRVDGVYYLVTSTFEYLPGLPVYRSTDLIEWVYVGNAVTRPEQVDIDDVPTPGGVWAPTLRYRDGVFYLIVTVMLGGRGCVVFTATDPAGPWSDGKVIAAVNGLDPDLAWDEDGTAYVTFAVMGRGIQQVRVDLDTGTALEDPRPMWSGTMYAPEGPHLYRRGDYWYLLIAEGGTERGHAVSIARGPAPDGPFEACPHNPLLTARSTLSLPKISSVLVKRHAGTRGECRRGGPVCGREGRCRRLAWGSAEAMGAVAGRSQFPDAAGGSCKTARTRAMRARDAAGSRSGSGRAVHGGRSAPTVP